MKGKYKEELQSNRKVLVVKLVKLLACFPLDNEDKNGGGVNLLAQQVTWYKYA